MNIQAEFEKICKNIKSSYDIKKIREFKNNDNVDFSFNNFEIFDIVIKNKLHPNFFKILLSRDETKNEFLNPKWFLRSLKLKNFEQFIFLFSKIENKEKYLYFLESLLLVAESSYIEGYKVVLKSFQYIHIEDENIYQEQIDKFVTFCIKEENYELFKIFTSYSYNKYLKNPNFFIDCKNLKNNSIKKAFFLNLLGSSNLVSSLSKDFIIDNFKNTNMFKGLSVAYNKALGDKLRFTSGRKKMSENKLKEELDFFIQHSNITSDFFTIELKHIYNEFIDTKINHYLHSKYPIPLNEEGWNIISYLVYHFNKDNLFIFKDFIDNQNKNLNETNFLNDIFYFKNPFLLSYLIEKNFILSESNYIFIFKEGLINTNNFDIFTNYFNYNKKNIDFKFLKEVFIYLLNGNHDFVEDEDFYNEKLISYLLTSKFFHPILLNNKKEFIKNANNKHSDNIINTIKLINF